MGGHYLTPGGVINVERAITRHLCCSEGTASVHCLVAPCRRQRRVERRADRLSKREHNPPRHAGAATGRVLRQCFRHAPHLRGVAWKLKVRFINPNGICFLEEVPEASDVNRWAGAHLSLLVEALQRWRALCRGVDERVPDTDGYGVRLGQLLQRPSNATLFHEVLAGVRHLRPRSQQCRQGLRHGRGGNCHGSRPGEKKMGLRETS
mmetsp:Transcript_773/g.2097  ORF Transcript_773/g.2097 Transcript_773/m.2097 type:complete len:207 (-) Transcript_773:9-629(-)